MDKDLHLVVEPVVFGPVLGRDVGPEDGEGHCETSRFLMFDGLEPLPAVRRRSFLADSRPSGMASGACPRSSAGNGCQSPRQVPSVGRPGRQDAVTL